MKKIVLAFCLIGLTYSVKNLHAGTSCIKKEECASFQDKVAEFPFPVTLNFKKNTNTSIKEFYKDLDKIAAYLTANEDVKVAIRANYNDPTQQDQTWKRLETIRSYFYEKWLISKERFAFFIDKSMDLNHVTIKLPTKEEIYRLENKEEMPLPPKTK